MKDFAENVSGKTRLGQAALSTLEEMPSVPAEELFLRSLIIRATSWQVVGEIYVEFRIGLLRNLDKGSSTSGMLFAKVLPILEK